MKLLLDMNLAPRWVGWLVDLGSGCFLSDAGTADNSERLEHPHCVSCLPSTPMVLAGEKGWRPTA